LNESNNGLTSPVPVLLNEHKQQRNALALTSQGEEENQLLLKQLQLQREINKNQVEEVKILKEQIESLNIELQHLRLGEEVYTQEKQTLKRQLDDMETQLNIAKQEANDNIKLHEQLRVLEASNRLLDEQLEASKGQIMIIESLRADLNDLSNQLQINESQKSELEFLYQETNVKLIDANTKLEEFRSQRRLEDVEFALEEKSIQLQEIETKMVALSETKKSVDKELLRLNGILSEKEEQIRVLNKQLADTTTKLTDSINEKHNMSEESKRSISELVSICFIWLKRVS
jgi:chromosome segregation ATPase